MGGVRPGGPVLHPWLITHDPAGLGSLCKCKLPYSHLFVCGRNVKSKYSTPFIRKVFWMEHSKLLIRKTEVLEKATE